MQNLPFDLVAVSILIADRDNLNCFGRTQNTTVPLSHELLIPFSPFLETDSPNWCLLALHLLTLLSIVHARLYQSVPWNIMCLLRSIYSTFFSLPLKGYSKFCSWDGNFQVLVRKWMMTLLPRSLLWVTIPGSRDRHANLHFCQMHSLQTSRLTGGWRRERLVLNISFCGTF